MKNNKIEYYTGQNVQGLIKAEFRNKTVLLEYLNYVESLGKKRFITLKIEQFNNSLLKGYFFFKEQK